MIGSNVNSWRHCSGYDPAVPTKSDQATSKPAQRVATSLREAIRTGSLVPGEHIRQELWAERLEVSRLPIREALSRLAADGTVEHDPNRGYFVAKRPSSEIAQ